MTTATKKTLALFALAPLLLNGCVSTESSGSGGGRRRARGFRGFVSCWAAHSELSLGDATHTRIERPLE